MAGIDWRAVLADLLIRSVSERRYHYSLEYQEAALVDYPGLKTACLSRSRFARWRQALEQFTRRRPPSGEESGSTVAHTTQRRSRRRSLLGQRRCRYVVATTVHPGGRASSCLLAVRLPLVQHTRGQLASPGR
jgi:hypothetical protein